MNSENLTTKLHHPIGIDTLDNHVAPQALGFWRFSELWDEVPTSAAVSDNAAGTGTLKNWLLSSDKMHHLTLSAFYSPTLCLLYSTDLSRNLLFLFCTIFQLFIQLAIHSEVPQLHAASIVSTEVKGLGAQQRSNYRDYLWNTQIWASSQPVCFCVATARSVTWALKVLAEWWRPVMGMRAAGSQRVTACRNGFGQGTEPQMALSGCRASEWVDERRNTVKHLGRKCCIVSSKQAGTLQSSLCSQWMSVCMCVCVCIVQEFNWGNC